MTYTEKLGFLNPVLGACNWDDDWYWNEDLKDTMLWQLMKRDYVVSGGGLSGASGLNITIADVTVVLAGVQYSFSGGVLGMTAGSGAGNVFNYIYVTPAGIQVSLTQPTEANYVMIGTCETDPTTILFTYDLRVDFASNIQTPVENDFINGEFNSWQYSIAETSIASGHNCADRIQETIADETVDVSRQTFTRGQTTVPGNLEYYYQMDVTTAGLVTSVASWQTKIPDVQKYSGKKVYFSIYAKADSGLDFSARVVQNFGTGGSSAVEVVVEKKTVTTSWVEYVFSVDMSSVSTKTIGVDSSTNIQIYVSAGSNFDALTDTLGTQTGIFDFAWGRFYASDIVMPVRAKKHQETLEECLPYYRVGSTTNSLLGITLATQARTAMIIFEPPMRAIPSITAVAGSAMWSGITSITVLNITKTSFSPRHNGTGMTPDTLEVSDIDWTAKAEL